LRGNLIISFAYKSFKWTNNAKHNAGVTVIVVGLAMSENVRNKIIYDGKQSRKVNNISPLLMDGATIFVKSETSPLCEDFPAMNFGNMPADGGKLIMSTEERDEFIGLYPGAEQFIRPLIGAEDFINGKQRWCVWLYDKNPKEYLAIPELRQRIEELKVIREKSSRPQLASIPHLFAQITQPLGVSFIIIPAVSSEHRNYIPMGYLDENHIAANSCMVVGTDEMWLFGILTSLMHMAWVKTVGGRLKTDYRYSAQLCYNTFPFPKVSDAKKREIEEAAEEVLLVREDYPGKTLAELYDPDKMPDDLREAHHRLDLIVESCYQDKPLANDEERLECLFRLY
jgi:hypothetical protein